VKPYHWSAEELRIIRRGTDEATRALNLTPRSELDPSNPNHPSQELQLFGQPAGEFMARQYRGVAP
jgi:hypothetical protein